MAVMESVGNGGRLVTRSRVHEERGEYVVELDVSEFTEHELSIELVGSRLTVRGDQGHPAEDEGQAFRLHERLEESFRLPDDADTARIGAVYGGGVLEIHAPRVRQVPRIVAIGRRQAPHLINPNADPC
jgi:HSP20 family molecular chaperone IbpA